MTVILMTAIAALLGLCLYAIAGMYRLQRPTRGPRIDKDARPGEALLIIDMQSDFTGRGGGYPADDVEAVISLINEHASDAYGRDCPVITVRHSFLARYVNVFLRLLARGRGAAGSAGLGLDPRLETGVAADFMKHQADAFSAPEFEAWLDAHRIGRLSIAGRDGNTGIRATAQAALNRGYEVEILAPAVLARAEPQWRLQQRRLSRRGARISM
ncbi:nicotinamidase-related amidase [Hoeflea marina]|uniref:Nicotinamidase-related amidase n=1 Tax=Hoeflea marina TaxID=274592 RepID=A0A317PNR0_9HYPH|nr:isochorismatase family cysteine hydrolase [Hoeflea marina]PWW01891.1 nicotinamidase-related amidase [Hoeflea marina]